MKPWIRRTLLGVLGAAIALGALTACGHHPYRGAGWNATAQEQARLRERVVDRVARRLDLDAAQKARLSALAVVLQQQGAALRGQPDPRAQVQALVAGARFDRSQAQALVAEKTAAIGTGSPQVITAVGDFYDSLDANQQAKVREYLQHRRGWWRRG